MILKEISHLNIKSEYLIFESVEQDMATPVTDNFIKMVLFEESKPDAC